MALKDIADVEYPYIMMVSQNINQQLDNANNPPIYNFSVVWQRYKILEDGTVVMNPDTQISHYDDNVYTTALTAAGGGNMVYVDALTAQELVIKAVVEFVEGVTLEVV